MNKQQDQGYLPTIEVCGMWVFAASHGEPSWQPQPIGVTSGVFAMAEKGEQKSTAI